MSAIELVITTMESWSTQVCDVRAPGVAEAMADASVRARAELAQLRARIEELEERVERLTAANRDTDRAVAHMHGEWMKATGASSPSDADHLFNLKQELEKELVAIRGALSDIELETECDGFDTRQAIRSILRGGPIGGGPER